MRRFDWLFGGLVRLVDCCEVNEKVGAAQLFQRIVSVIVIRFSLKLRIESRVFPQGKGSCGTSCEWLRTSGFPSDQPCVRSFDFGDLNVGFYRVFGTFFYFIFII